MTPVAAVLVLFSGFFFSILWIVWDLECLDRSLLWRKEIRDRVVAGIGPENREKTQNVLSEFSRVSYTKHYRHVRRFQNPADLYNFDPVTLEKKDQR